MKDQAAVVTWMTAISAQLTVLTQAVKLIETKLEELMSTTNNLAAEQAVLASDVTALRAALDSAVKDLKDQIAVLQSGQTPDITSMIDSVAKIEAATAALTAADPGPQTTPPAEG